ncbi:MAG: diguanylate cyclase domain-containing protein [Eubacteriaceae bacterium]|jgi:GGDEF domain-containing protein
MGNTLKCKKPDYSANSDITKSVNLTEKEQAVLDRSRETAFTAFKNEEITLALAFDGRTRERIKIPGDVLPPGVSPLLTLYDIRRYFAENICPEDAERVKHICNLENFAQNGDEINVEFRLMVKLEEQQQSKWYTLCCRRSLNAVTGITDTFLRMRDIDQGKRNQLELIDSIRTDQLTGFLNCDSFEREFDEIISQSDRKSYAMVIIGFDNLSLYACNGVNADIDTILRQASLTLKTMTASNNLCGRAGYTKLIVLAELDEEFSYFKERLRILQMALAQNTAEQQRITVSIGVNLIPVNQKCSYKSARERSENALEKAWKLGGDQVQFFTDGEQSQKDISNIFGKQQPELEQKAGDKRVFIRTFGHFDIFVDGHPLLFRNPKAKELLAILVDRSGGYVASDDAISYLWENEAINKVTRSRYRKTAMYLKKTLEDNGVFDIMEVKNRKRCIIPDRVDCDYYDFQKNGKHAIHPYRGSYMLNYSWGEVTAAELDLTLEY